MNHAEVFFYERVSYSVETKYKAVEMKIAGFSTKEIMKELNIKIEHKWKLGGDGIEMRKVIDFHNTLGNNIPTVKD